MQQPPVVEQRGGCVGPLVVAGGHRGAAEQQLADVTLGQLLERLRVDDLHLQTGHGLAEQRELPGGEAELVGIADLDGLGHSLRLEHDPVDRVGHEPSIARRERAGDRHLGHAERREHATRREPEPARLGDERIDGLRVDRLRTGQRDGEIRQVEVLHPLERPGGEHPREVRPGGRRCAVVGEPLHPVARVGEEVLRRRLHEVDALGHRHREEPDQAHVVVQRQPRHEQLLVAHLGRLGQRIDVGAQHPVGDHHALGFARRTARVLQDHQTLGIVRGKLQRVARRHVGRTGHDAAHRQDRRVARRRRRRSRRAGRR